jgi:hypothetical protein
MTLLGLFYHRMSMTYHRPHELRCNLTCYFNLSITYCSLHFLADDSLLCSIIQNGSLLYRTSSIPSSSQLANAWIIRLCRLSSNYRSCKACVNCYRCLQQHMFMCCLKVQHNLLSKDIAGTICLLFPFPIKHNYTHTIAGQPDYSTFCVIPALR